MKYFRLLCLLLLATTAKAQIGVGNYSNSYLPTSLPNPMFNGGGCPRTAGACSFLHFIDPAEQNTVLVVGCAMNMYPLQTVDSVSYGVFVMTKAWEQRNLFSSGNPITQEWFLFNPPSGTNQVIASYGPTATNGHGVACQAVDLFGVDTSDIESSASHSSGKFGSGGTHSIDCVMAVGQDGDVIVMFEYSTGYNFTSISASPTPLSYATGRYAAPQNSLVVTPALLQGTNTETWTLTGSATNLEFSVGGITFKAK